MSTPPLHPKELARQQAAAERAESPLYYYGSRLYVAAAGVLAGLVVTWLVGGLFAC